MENNDDNSSSDDENNSLRNPGCNVAERRKSEFLNSRLQPRHRDKVNQYGASDDFVCAGSMLPRCSQMPRSGQGSSSAADTSQHHNSQKRPASVTIDSYFSKDTEEKLTNIEKSLSQLKNSGEVKKSKQTLAQPKIIVPDKCSVPDAFCINLTDEELEDCITLEEKALQECSVPEDAFRIDLTDEELDSCYTVEEQALKDMELERNPFNIKDIPPLPAADHVSNLPEEILAHIFTFLPKEDLRSCQKTCGSWHHAVRSSGLLFWKRIYNKQQQKKPRAIEKVRGTFKFDYKVHSQLLPSLIRYFISFKPVSGGYIHPLISQHRLYSTIVQLFNERLQDCLIDKEVANPWCALAAIIILARDLTDLWDVVDFMSQGFRVDIMEGIYAFACGLHDIWTLSWLPFCIYYRLAYVFHHLEKGGGVKLVGLKEKLAESKSGQQTIMRYGSDDSDLRLTHEQLRIARHDLQVGNVVKIKAFAGTGKTTTLLYFARFNPNKRFLLIVYNKSMQLHAEKIFPRNVECRTGHSLGYAAVGRKYKRLVNITKRILYDLVKKRDGVGNFYIRVRMVEDTLKKFFASDHPQLSLRHVPNDGETNISQQKAAVLEDAEAIWNQMVDLSNWKVSMSHDGYLKLWQLSHPTINGYDGLLIDEAQDITPCLLDVLLRQSHIPKIFVGDPHQRIYSFRGAVNCMALSTHTHTYALTESFRFGFDIAVVANVLLHYQGEKDWLIGNNSRSYVDGSHRDGQITVICRTNMAIFNYSVDECCIKRSGKSIFFIGGIYGVGLDGLLDVHWLSLKPEERLRRKHHEISDNFIKRFADKADGFHKLRTYANNSKDNELVGKIEIVLRYRDTLPEYVAMIEAHMTCRQDGADIVFTSAHKSKGLEFDRVVLANDFVLEPREEVNLLYVAASRAKKCLVLNKDLHRLIFCQGRFSPLQPLPTAALKPPFTALKMDALCNAVEEAFEPVAFTLFLPNFTVQTGVDALHFQTPVRGREKEMWPGYRDPKSLDSLNMWSGLLGAEPKK